MEDKARKGPQENPEEIKIPDLKTLIANGEAIAVDKVDFDPKSGKGNIVFRSFKDMLLFQLHILYTTPKINPNLKAEIKGSYDYIKRVYAEISIKLKPDMTGIDVEFKQIAETTEEEAQKFINTPYVLLAVARIEGREKEYLKAIGGEDLGLQTGTMRKSAYYIDHLLRYDYPKRGGGDQLELWASVDPDIKEKIEDHSVLVEGIKLSPGEYKLIDCINYLLHTKSQTTAPGEEKTFYSGNEPAQIVPYGKERSVAPIIRIKPSELYNQYKAGKKPSGEDIKEVKSLLQGLQDRKFYIRYQRKVKAQGKNKEDKIQRIETYAPLLHILKFYEYTQEEVNRVDSGDRELKDRREELIIQLNPIFKDQINTQYIRYPLDIDRRMLIAHGGSHKRQQSTLLLRDYLLREFSHKRYKPEINYDKLLYQLGLEKYIKESRKQLIKKNLSKAIEVNKNLGLLLRVEEATGSQGQLKYIFHLNKDFIQ